MLKEKDFIDKIPQNCKVALFGAGTVGKIIQSYIQEERPDINIICYIDSFITGNIDGIKIYNIKEIENIKNQFELLVITTRTELPHNLTLFKYFDIDNILIPTSVEKCCREKKLIPLIEKASQIFSSEEDKILYKNLTKLWFEGSSSKIEDYVEKKHNIHKQGPTRNYLKQYLEYINYDAIETIIDAGVCNGIQFFSYKKLFKNLKTIYGFEPMYDKFKNEIFDYFLTKINEIKIIDKGLWKKPEKLTFVETTNMPSASYIKNTRAIKKSKTTDNITEIETTTIDIFKIENNIAKVDFIKMDIEGSELPALKGGEQTILSDRPQLAISIYHSIHDFVEIPLYLHQLLQDKDYTFHIGHYSPKIHETVLYAIPNELIRN